MQSSAVDSKVATLWNNYRDNAIIQELPQEVEELRRRALFVGVGVTGGILFANEAARFISRSPLFKLNPINAALVLAAPTIAAKYAMSAEIEGKLENLWRIHENREEQGLEGTYQKDGIYTDKTNNTGFVQPFTMDVTGREIFNGTKMEGVLDSPFNRFSHEIAENPEFHEDLD